MTEYFLYVVGIGLSAFLVLSGCGILFYCIGKTLGNEKK